MLQRWRAVGNTVSDLTGPGFEPRTSRPKDKRANARPTGRYASLKIRCDNASKSSHLIFKASSAHQF